MNSIAENNRLVSLTESAAGQIKTLFANEKGSVGKVLRVFVEKGGCAGMQYGMVFDRRHPRWGKLLGELNMPADFAIVNRLQWGLTSILSQLHATANWRAIIDEYIST